LECRKAVCNGCCCAADWPGAREAVHGAAGRTITDLLPNPHCFLVHPAFETQNELYPTRSTLGIPLCPQQTSARYHMRRELAILCSCHIVITYPESLQGCALARRGAHRRRCTMPRPSVAHERCYPSRLPMRAQIVVLYNNHMCCWIIQARETKTKCSNGRCLTCRLVFKNKSSRRSNRVIKVTVRHP
jgi:hypothetical protein